MQSYPFHHRHRLPGLFVLFLLATASMIAQTPNPLDFFPHAVGNTWEYSDESTGELAWTETFIGDSTNARGDLLIRYRVDYPKSTSPSFGWYVIDSAFSVFRVSSTRYLDSLASTPLYRLSARHGDKWRFRASDTINWAEVIELYDGGLYGRPCRFMTIEYYVKGADFRMWEKAYTLATGFGRTYIATHPSGRYYLSGAIINGKRYGRISGVDVAAAVADKFACFPNPTNNRTIVECSDIKSGTVHVNIYDVLGREVVHLEGEHSGVGTYRTSIDCASLPHGTYIVRLAAGDIVRSTILTVRR